MISKNEYIVTTYYNAGEVVGVITSKYPGTVYYFYERLDKDCVKLGKADSPTELEKRYDVNRRMGLDDE